MTDGDAQRFWERLCAGHYGVVPLHVLADPLLTANEKALYGLLCAFAMEGGECWPASDLLCAALGWGGATLKRTRQSLVRKGRLALRRGRNNTWRYQIDRSAPSREKSNLRRIETMRQGLGVPRGPAEVIDLDAPPLDADEPEIEDAYQYMRAVWPQKTAFDIAHFDRALEAGERNDEGAKDSILVRWHRLRQGKEAAGELAPIIAAAPAQ